MTRRLIGYILTAAGVLLAVGAVYALTHRDIPLVFSPTQMLASLWSDYKLGYVEDFRTVDRQRNNVTTSEGQSYTMLRAVWMGDRETFDGAWQWTKDNLDRPNDRLSSWLFGQHDDGSWGVLTEEGGYNSASDADQDMALALIFAYARWQDIKYLGDANLILQDLWGKEVFMANGKPYLAANDLEKFSTSTTAIVNPSYFAPYAYRIFAMVDPNHDWLALVDTSYEVIDQSFSEGQLPPDWARIDKRTGAVVPADDLSENFSYDALRTPWRLALDYQWYGDGRALNLLTKMSTLKEQWSASGVLTPRTRASEPFDKETPALYGAAIGYFMLTDQAASEEIYKQKLQYLYDPTVNRFKERLPYYDDNWAWFGIALYNDLLPNLGKTLPPTR